MLTMGENHAFLQSKINLRVFWRSINNTWSIGESLLTSLFTFFLINIRLCA